VINTVQVLNGIETKRDFPEIAFSRHLTKMPR